MRRTIALLPEGKVFDRIYDEALKPSAEEAGCEISRADPEFSRPNQLGAFCTAIEKADLVLADLTSRNPNVFYQTGYAHALGKKVLLIAAHGEDFPFDKTRHDVIIYSGDPAFLKSEMRTYLATGEISGNAGTEQGRESDARALFEKTFGDILAAHGHRHNGSVEMENSRTFILVGQDMDLALVQDLARRARELGLRLKLM